MRIITPNNYKDGPNIAKQDNIIHVIRKTNISSIQKSWWSPRTREDNYYSSFLQDKHFIYSFTDSESAKRCLEFLNEYKSKYNGYPDLHKNKFTENNTNNFTEPIVDNDIVYIEQDILMSLKYRCQVNNASLLLINKFDYTFSDTFLIHRNFFDLNISGIDILENEPINYDVQVEHYNYLIEM